MMLKIACQQCGHIGLANVETLPRQLRCSRCGCSRRVEAKDGARIVNRVAFEEWLFGASGAPRAQSREHVREASVPGAAGSERSAGLIIERKL